MTKPTITIVVGMLFVVFGAFYLAAAMGIAFEDRLSDSAGGPWVQGFGAVVIGLGAIGWGIALNIRDKERQPRDKSSKTDYPVGIKHQ